MGLWHCAASANGLHLIFCGVCRALCLCSADDVQNQMLGFFSYIFKTNKTKIAFHLAIASPRRASLFIAAAHRNGSSSKITGTQIVLCLQRHSLFIGEFDCASNISACYKS